MGIQLSLFWCTKAWSTFTNGNFTLDMVDMGWKGRGTKGQIGLPQDADLFPTQDTFFIV